ncbi:unnamed protein product [Spirodela intermedia]|uniref:Uncharacterized protein n=1 Tax=Spirodela intermedia TaxID=51605 RepID=A0A7I8JSP0_SPIIN|nr:unnamed protein product [Spirodela intermedia]CAA6672603.1 unnamed protein product [Spirodela intermedia]
MVFRKSQRSEKKIYKILTQSSHVLFLGFHTNKNMMVNTTS